MTDITHKINLLWNRICYNFDIMKNKVNKSGWYKVIFGETKTRQVSGVSYRIVNSKELSEKIYSKIDSSDNFTVTGNDGKTYKIKQLVPSK